MSIEVRPLGIACNLGCVYCYQNPERDSGQARQRSYDMQAMKDQLRKKNGPFTIFGGEGLLVPEADLEELWRWGFSKWGKNSIQTNGTLINDNHVRMFKAYNVHVGFSIDGPGALNDARWAGSLQATREATRKSLAALDRLLSEGSGVSLIVTLHRGNATADRLPIMYDWFRRLDQAGLKSARLHALEIDSHGVQKSLSLSREQTIDAFWGFHELERQLTGLKFDVFRDMISMLRGQDKRTTCIWRGCDPYTTRAVQGVEGNGQASNCTRTNKDGVEFVKSSIEGFERQVALYHTPQNDGGCKDCRFFLMCRGNCPGGRVRRRRHRPRKLRRQRLRCAQPDGRNPHVGQPV
jgi:uncharacterized protein